MRVGAIPGGMTSNKIRPWNPSTTNPNIQAMVAEIEADMAAQLARVREMERNGELEPIPELAAE